MKKLKTAVIILYGLSALVGYVFSALYLFRNEFMPYHAVALNATWEEVQSAYQVLILALMKVSGGGWLGVSVTITFLIREYARTERVWPLTASLVTGLSILIPTLYAVFWVKNNSAANPPWIAALGVILLLLTGWILALVRKHHLKKPQS
jgi:hypothetical protein